MRRLPLLLRGREGGGRGSEQDMAIIYSEGNNQGGMDQLVLIEW